MVHILHIETSAEICSVCISSDHLIVAESIITEAYSHSQFLALEIQKVVHQANIQMTDLAAVSLSAGPGSYTGLRVGASIAKGICYSIQKPLIAIDTLAIIANPYKGKGAKIIPTQDARRDEAYIALFDENLVPLRPAEAHIFKSDSFIEYKSMDAPIIICGNAAEKAQTIIEDHSFIQFYPRKSVSTHMVELALRAFKESNFVDVAYFEPQYLKSPNITSPKKNRFL